MESRRPKMGLKSSERTLRNTQNSPERLPYKAPLSPGPRDSPSLAALGVGLGAGGLGPPEAPLERLHQSGGALAAPLEPPSAGLWNPWPRVGGRT